MANSAKHPVEPHRVPPHAAAGLDDEITAQPRLPGDEPGLSDGGNAGLSIEPEDMGRRWLSEATEQGEALQSARLEDVLDITSGPDTDEALVPPNFEHENTLWEQTIDLATETQNAADQLRGPAAFADDSEFEGDAEIERLEREAAERGPQVYSVNSNDIREFSLLDQIADDGENTIAPHINAEQQNPVEQGIPRAELGAQVEPKRAPSARVGDPKERERVGEPKEGMRVEARSAPKRVADAKEPKRVADAKEPKRVADAEPRRVGGSAEAGRGRPETSMPRLRGLIGKLPRRATEPVLRGAAAVLRRLAGMRGQHI